MEDGVLPFDDDRPLQQPDLPHARLLLSPAEQHEARLVGRMREAYGPGPDGATCGQCVHLYARRRANTYFKCALGPQSFAASTDWRRRWLACGQFSPR